MASALGHADGPLVEAASDLDAEEVMNWPLALQFYVKLHVLEEGVHVGLSMCGDEKVVHVDTNNLNAVLGLPSE